MKKKSKIILWSVLSFLFVVLFVGMLIGTWFANHYSNTINGFLGVKTFEIVNVDESTIDSRYFKSDYMDGDSFDYTALWDAANEVCRTVAEEGATLLWNEGDALPLASDASVSLFGQRAVNWAYVTGGSASTDVTGSPDLRTSMSDAGFEVNRTLWAFYDTGAGSSYKGQQSRRINEVPWSVYPDNVKNSFSTYGDAAIVVLGRHGGENDDLSTSGSDGMDGSYLDLSAEEKDMLDNVVSYKKNGTFSKVIVLIASDHALSMKNLMPYKGDVDACVWVGNAGRQSTPAVANILNGTANPCGSLVDTYLYDNLRTPVMANFGDYTYGNLDNYPKLKSRINAGNREGSYIVYQEGIYSGYRYFETRYEDTVLKEGNASGGAGAADGSTWSYGSEVAFPFGYTMSYTDFETANFRCSQDGDDYVLSVDVKNTGDVPGKKSVQFYLQKPFTEYDKTNGIEKASVELVGFDKTGKLDVGASETVTVRVPKESFRTYDAQGKGTYILEKGNYYLSYGENAHDALNNILAKKGKTTADGMDAAGNASFASEISVASDDFEIYATSADTENEIVNRFDDVDVNRYANKGDNSVKYLTRSDWTGSYPTSTVQLSLNDAMVNDLEICKTPVEDEGSENYEFTYGANNGRKLVELREIPFEHELWDALLDQMTLEEQVMLNVKGSLSTTAVPSVGAPPTYDFDGPMGLRKYVLNGTTQQLCFPGEPVQGATFDPDLIKSVGDMFGETMLHANYQVLYAPACNIHRSAFSARNSEYYSEDAYLNGMLAGACIEGAQAKGALLTLKHFALNDQDFNRYAVGVWCNEQAMREVFLRPFEVAVRTSDPLALMTSYNRIGTTWTGGSYNLITEVLRGEWGFNGFIISDAWSSSTVGAMNYIDGLMAGNDVEFTSGTYADLEQYLDSPTVKQRLRDSAHRTLYALSRSSAMNGLTSSSKIVLLLGWWQYALVAIDILLGLLMAGAIVMLILSILGKGKKPKISADDGSK